MEHHFTPVAMDNIVWRSRETVCSREANRLTPLFLSVYTHIKEHID